MDRAPTMFFVDPELQDIKYYLRDILLTGVEICFFRLACFNIYLIQAIHGYH